MQPESSGVCRVWDLRIWDLRAWDPRVCRLRVCGLRSQTLCVHAGHFAPENTMT